MNQRAIYEEFLYSLDEAAAWLDTLVGEFVPNSNEIVQNIQHFQIVPNGNRWYVIVVINTYIPDDDNHDVFSQD